ncbi:MAG: Ppx/GppA family phosphatase ['Candidatus Kapabacteria' thiocyanatum]|nr:Ppx/GppA family phosphatase ['Candidatus Kapabacteria' thiocyanatum]
MIPDSLSSDPIIGAGIDIGTNTMLMVIGRMDGNDLVVMRDEHSIARLGEGVDATGTISEAAVVRGCDILGRYAAIIRDMGVSRVRAVATSAMRDATNATEVRHRLEQALGWPIDVIDGEEEAGLTFIGTVGTDDRPATVIDIGGGSTEFVKGTGGVVSASRSIDIGAVRCTERYLGTLPADRDAILKARGEIRTMISDIVTLIGDAGRLVGVAGTPTSLAAVDQGLASFDASRIDGYVLTAVRVHDRAEELLRYTLDEVRALPGVHPQRADILPAGALLLDEAMSVLGADSVTVSTRGLRYGVLLSMLRQPSS